MKRSVLALIWVILLVAGPGIAAPGDFVCKVGRLALPKIDGWESTVVEEMPDVRSACVFVREDEDRVVGTLAVRSAKRGLKELGDQPQPALMVELIQYLGRKNIQIGEPKWRKMDVPFSGPGMAGFGKGIMFGFDGIAIEGEGSHDVIVLLFDGSENHYDVTLTSPAEASDKAEFMTNVAAFKQLLSGVHLAKEH